MFYVPCRVESMFDEVYYKVKNISNMFDYSQISYNGKVMNIICRGFPKTYIDACIDTRFNVIITEVV